MRGPGQVATDPKRGAQVDGVAHSEGALTKEGGGVFEALGVDGHGVHVVPEQANLVLEVGGGAHDVRI